MDARAIIVTVREGGVPSDEALQWFAAGLADGTVTDAQAGAFAMAVLLRGLGEAGRVALTRAMRDSGRVLRWSLDAPALDKHSTGGVGDCVSLPLAPALAACGAYVPMISGRGLGHTGGTLDKLEAIPGYRTGLDEAEFRRVVKDVGCSIVAASREMAPADRRLYAVRDVTGTVESIDLITASILSKKLAAGLDVLVLDVKCGSGAFMKTLEDATALAQSLVTTANGAGCKTTALITDMDAPMIADAGNAVEVAASMRMLTGAVPRDALWGLTVALGGEALATAGLARDAADGESRITTALETGRAAEVFGRMVAAQGGPADFVENWQSYLPKASVLRPIPAPRAGWVSAIDGQEIGLAVVALGGGRQREADKVDPSVGLTGLVPLGAEVRAGEPLGFVHASDEAHAQAAVARVAAAYAFDGPAYRQDLVIKRIS
jgi:thymidine phosphorylase